MRERWRDLKSAICDLAGNVFLKIIDLIRDPIRERRERKAREKRRADIRKRDPFIYK